MKRPLLILAATVALLLAAPSPAHATVACTITSASVDAGTATFTVGPTGCTGTVGPVSFSSYLLPGGKILPFSEQVLIEHHASNGTTYGPGGYTLTVSLAGALCWQTDLYYGASIDVPPHPHTIAVDYQQGTPPCQTVPTTTSSAPTTTLAVPPSTSTTPAPTTTVSESTSTSSPTTSTEPSTTASVPGSAPAVPTSTPTTSPLLSPSITVNPLTPQLPETGNGSRMAAALAAASLALGVWILSLSRRKENSHG